MSAREELLGAITDAGVGAAFAENEVDGIIESLQQRGYYLAPLTTEGGPTARTTDPRTSKVWNGERMRKGSQAHLLLETFGQWPDDGLTDEQAMEKSSGVAAASEYAKRCSDLRAAGLIHDTGRDREGGSGYPRIVSEITEKGKAVLARLADQ